MVRTFGFWDNDDNLGYYNLSETSPAFNGLFSINTLMAPYDAANYVSLVAYDEEGTAYYNDDSFEFLALAPYSGSSSANGCYLFMYTMDGSLAGWNLNGNSVKFDAITYAGKGADDNGNTTAYYYALRNSNNSSTNNHLYLFTLSGEVGTDEETGEAVFNDMLGYQDLGAVSGLPFPTRSNMSANYSMSYYYDPEVTDKEVLFIADNSTSLMYVIEIPVTDDGLGTPTASYLCMAPGATGVAALFNTTFDLTQSRPQLPTQGMTNAGKAMAIDLNKKVEEVVEPVIEEVVIEEAVIEEPIVEEPVIEEPVIEEPIVEEPIIEEPIVEEPVAEGTLNYIRDFSPSNKANPINKIILNNASVSVPEVQGTSKNVEYYEDVAVGNGLVQIDYDPAVTSFLGVESPFDYTSVVDDGNGTVMFAFAQEAEIAPSENENKVLVATFKFASNCENAADIGLTIKERNDNDNVAEVRNVTIAATGHDYNFSEFEWTLTPGAYTAKAVYVCANDSDHVVKYDAVITTSSTAPTCEAAGQIVYTASYDGHSDEKTEVVAALDHDYQFSKFEWTETPGDYTAKAVYVCSRDEEHVVKYDAEISKVTTDSTCEDDGKIVYTASYDGHSDEKTEVLDALGHDYKFVEFVWSEDCRSAEAKFVCQNDSEHVKYYEAEVEEVDREEPNCDDDGYVIYEAVYDEYSDTKRVELSALGHDYQFSHFDWSEDYEGAEAVYRCSHNEEEEETYEATVTSEVTTQPGCETTGVRTYTASYDGHTDTKEVELPALEHDYQFSKFEWTETAGNYTAKAVYVCSHDSEHVVKYDAQISKVTTDPTCEEDGKTVYTASYDGHSDEKTEVLDALDHDYQFAQFEWTYVPGNYTAKAIYVCSHDENHVVKYDAEISKVTTDPTCTEIGKTVYTASYEGHTENKTEPLDAIGHDWKFSKFVWTETPGAFSAKALYVCANDSEHTIEFDVVVVVKEEPLPTCEGKGLRTYTASFCLEGEEVEHVEEKYEDIAQFGHKWQFTGFEWANDYSSAQAVFVCQNDPEHVMKIDAEISEKIIRQATRDRDGEKNVTATVVYKDEVYSDTIEGVPFTGVDVNLISLFATMSASLCGLYAVIRRKKDEE